jgi:hypothetical protein
LGGQFFFTPGRVTLTPNAFGRWGSFHVSGRVIKRFGKKDLAACFPCKAAQNQAFLRDFTHFTYVFCVLEDRRQYREGRTR